VPFPPICVRSPPANIKSWLLLPLLLLPPRGLAGWRKRGREGEEAEKVEGEEEEEVKRVGWADRGWLLLPGTTTKACTAQAEQHRASAVSCRRMLSAAPRRRSAAAASMSGGCCSPSSVALILRLSFIVRCGGGLREEGRGI